MSLMLLFGAAGTGLPAVVVTGFFDQPTPGGTSFDQPTPAADSFDAPTPGAASFDPPTPGS